jgi:uncharacterized protein with HEPN domain
MKKDPRIFLQHILESIEQLEDYTFDVLESEFMESLETQDAVLRRLEVIGEAVKNIPDEFKKNHPNIPWRKIAGMRDTVIHEYFNVDLPLVWSTVKEDIPKLREQVKELLGSNG